jgi:hypothetical protein
VTVSCRGWRASGVDAVEHPRLRFSSFKHGGASRRADWLATGAKANRDDTNTGVMIIYTGGMADWLGYMQRDAAMQRGR